MTPRGWGLGSGGSVTLAALLAAALMVGLLAGCTSTVAGFPTAVGAGSAAEAGAPPAAPAAGVCALLTPQEVAAVIGPGPAGVALPGTDLENCTWVSEGDDAIVLTMAPPGTTDLGGLEGAGLGTVFSGNGKQGLVHVISSTKDAQQESAKLAELIQGRL